MLPENDSKSATKPRDLAADAMLEGNPVGVVTLEEAAAAAAKIANYVAARRRRMEQRLCRRYRTPSRRLSR